MIWFPISKRIFARSARLSMFSIVVAASSFAAVPTFNSSLPGPHVSFNVPTDLFLAPAKIDIAPVVSNFPITQALFRDAPEIDAASLVSKNEFSCLAKAIYFEARGEPERGQRAVAKVVLNRVESQRYPDTICGVVYQNAKRRNACQFSFACDGHPDIAKEKTAWRRAKSVAEDIIEGRNIPGPVITATHYHADYVRPYWAGKMKRLSKIGRHIFYRG